ncbi:hypothetical protein CFBP5507_24940 (plasmid) [Agrobacterium salinitolerans]|uniref:Uncharacterized protein n=1 Tax=Agrobacterium salinitolerans TaxID=1183413 RepID=A0A9X9KGM6_9HYPH|nr:MULTISPECIES: hypothetical protein [Agrobacterium]MDH6298113.1 hypothetical protein [Agrobacterium fabrum]UYZ11072.1 hypothetical protein CFBP5507_24940 [Agrobacterium salinitolerans]
MISKFCLASFDMVSGAPVASFSADAPTLLSIRAAETNVLQYRNDLTAA